MLNNNKDLYNEIDMLKGNINRMCVTDDIRELRDMRHFALLRLIDIYEYNLKKLENKKNYLD